jgi:N-carbamoylputrescine amidase
MSTTSNLARTSALLILTAGIALPLGFTRDPNLAAVQAKQARGPSEADPKAAKPRSLRIAVVQMQSNNNDIDGNLRRAFPLAKAAAAQGARLVVFPELMPTGYSLAYDVWDSAEPSHGKTVRWLKSTSRRLGIWLGTSFLEADGEDFFNTFVLTTPQGEEAGRVRKQVPADVEAFFFKGADGPHVIDTAIGSIGIGICAESYYCFLATLMLKNSADLILMPHSSPDSSESGGLPSPPGTHLASWYASHLGVPVAMVNKVGRWKTKALRPPPDEVTGFFPGLSAIVDSDGTVRKLMNNKEGVGVSDVTLDPRRKIASGPVCTGIGIAALTIGGPSAAAGVGRVQVQGRASYESNALRKQKALAVSEHSHTNSPQ